jgi:DNA-binding MarR family transcriptional regulator
MVYLAENYLDGDRERASERHTVSGGTNVARNQGRRLHDPDRLELTMLRTARAIRRAYDLRLSSLGLNLTEASLLLFARDQDGLTQRELADLLHIGRASAGGFIDGLERRGLVRRRPHASDRRMWTIEVTPDGLPLTAAFNEFDLQIRNEFRAGLSRDERRILADLLLRVEENVHAAANRSTPSAGAPSRSPS